MTVTETGPAAAAELAEVPDGEAPSHGERRAMLLVKQGWHARVDGRWFLVEKVTFESGVTLWFAGGPIFNQSGTSLIWTRTPAEQIAYMASLLPARDHYRPRRPLGTLYGGSARDPVADLP